MLEKNTYFIYSSIIERVVNFTTYRAVAILKLIAHLSFPFVYRNKPYQRNKL